MIRILGLVVAGGILLGHAATAKAQGVVIGSPYGYGPGVYAAPYAYGANTFVGFGRNRAIVYPTTTYYRSAYVAPGTVGYAAPAYTGFAAPYYSTTTYYTPGWGYPRRGLFGRYRW
jgi:hypothetical protein